MYSLFTYNLCWEALDGAKGNIDMRHCIQDGKNNCIKNIANTINQIGNKLDFLCFQEIMDNQQWGNLKKELHPQFYKNYKWSFCSPTKRSGIMTIWNTKKYTLIYEKCGDLLQPDYSNYTGRPYHICVFREGIVLVNVHFPHANQISGNTIKPVIELLRTELMNIPRNYNIIIMGDFNSDARKYIKHIHNRFYENRDVNNFPTCCSPISVIGKKHRTWNFDHIFTTLGKPTLYITINNDDVSDHLPVLSVVDT